MPDNGANSRSARDLNQALTGVFLILVAMLALYVSWPLSSKSDVGLGPGYAPKMFAIIQLAFGAVMLVHGFLQPGEASEPWHLRPLALILGSVAFFAISIERLGLVVAVMGLVLLACAANRGTRFREALVLALGSALFCWLVFVKALGMTIRLWPPIPGMS